MPEVRSLTDRSRKPTGKPTNPIILVSGEDLSGKTFASLLLTASPRIGQSWMMQLGEVDGDPYGAIEDDQGRPVRFTLVEHDGTWADIMAAATQIRDAALAAVTAGEKTPVWIFDSTSKEWELLTRYAENRARKSPRNKKELATDPDADIKVAHLQWNAANRRHRDFMAIVTSFPGIVILTARGKMTSVIGPNGQPTEGQKEYTIEANKSLGHQVTAHVRLSKDEPPTIIGIRLAKGGIIPGVDRPMVIDGRRDPRFKDVKFSLEWLIFDVLKFDPDNSTTRAVTEPVPDSDPDDAEIAETMGISIRCVELKKAIAHAGNGDTLRPLWAAISSAVKTQEITVEEGKTLQGDWRDKAMEIGMSKANLDKATNDQAKTNEPKPAQVAA